MCNVSRLDRWKDPHSVIDAFAQAKHSVPDLQLVLVGALPGEGPHDFRIAREVADYAAGIHDVRVMTSYTGVGRRRGGRAPARRARVAAALAARGLRPGGQRGAVEADAGGRRAGRRDRVTGGARPRAASCRRRGRHGRAPDRAGRGPGARDEMGSAGRERVRERFLVTRLLEDELRLLESVAGGTPGTLSA